MTGSSTISAALAELRAGRPVVVYDERSREGDVVLAAQFATREAVAFMALHARGIVCTALTPERWDALDLDAAAPGDASSLTVSVSARGDGDSTGGSASDRARAARTLADPAAGPDALLRPGHMFALRTRAGGVLEHGGPAEAAVDLVRLAGLSPAAVTCGILDEEGSMARLPELEGFCDEQGLALVEIEALAAHRRRHEPLVERVVETTMPTRHGLFHAVGFREFRGDLQHVAFVRGDGAAGDDVLVRVHAACLAGDVFASQRCDCRTLLESALRRIDEEGAGVVLYLTEDGTGDGGVCGSHRHLDPHVHAVIAQILADLGTTSARLLNEEPELAGGLEEHGLPVTGRVPLRPDLEQALVSR